MKAVVVEIKGNDVAVLSDNGCIYKVKNKKYTLGQEIIIRNNSKYIKLVASAAACLMLFVTPVWAYLTPYSYVSIDVNPSFEFSINRFDRVLQVKAINDDGQKVAEQIDISQFKNKGINEAVKNVLTELKDYGYLSNAKEDSVVVAASSKTQERTDKLATGLKLVVEEIKVKQDKAKDVITVSEVEPTEQEVNQAENQKEDKKIEEAQKEQIKSEKEQTKEENKEEKEALKDNNESEKEALTADKESEKEIKKVEKEQEKKERKDKASYDSDFDIQVIEVSQEEVNKAKDKGVTPGKMNLVEKLQLSAEAAGESIDTEEWLNRPVKDIMKEIKEYEKSAKQEEKDNKNNKESDNKSNKNKDDESNSSKKVN